MGMFDQSPLMGLLGGGAPQPAQGLLGSAAGQPQMQPYLQRLWDFYFGNWQPNGDGTYSVQRGNSTPDFTPRPNVPGLGQTGFVQGANPYPGQPAQLIGTRG